MQLEANVSSPLPSRSTSEDVSAQLRSPSPTSHKEISLPPQPQRSDSAVPGGGPRKIPPTDRGLYDSSVSPDAKIKS